MISAPSPQVEARHLAEEIPDRGSRLNPIEAVAGCWVGGWALGFVGISAAFPLLLRWVGLAILILSLPLGLPALRAMVRAGTSPNPARPPAALLTTGIYGRTRNPMYLGMFLISSGSALAVGSLGALLTLPLAIAIVDRAVVRIEERRMVRVFGRRFLEYADRVPRWL
jgi:protein-S-isoprenylcysteine O-methyltransferase Ste14